MSEESICIHELFSEVGGILCLSLSTLVDLFSRKGGILVSRFFLNTISLVNIDTGEDVAENDGFLILLCSL